MRVEKQGTWWPHAVQKNASSAEAWRWVHSPLPKRRPSCIERGEVGYCNTGTLWDARSWSLLTGARWMLNILTVTKKPPKHYKKTSDAIWILDRAIADLHPTSTAQHQARPRTHLTSSLHVSDATRTELHCASFEDRDYCCTTGRSTS